MNPLNAEEVGTFEDFVPPPDTKGATESDCEAEAGAKPEAETEAEENGATAPRRHRRVRFEDFLAYMPSHQYIYKPTREMWPGGSVDSRLPKVKVGVNKEGKDVEIRASQWLDQNQPVEQMTWAPGKPMLIENKLVADGGWIDRRGATVFNLYRGPSIWPGHAQKANRWVDHVKTVYPESADHIIKWLASKVQSPEIKINHALVLGGDRGIGKDTILEPIKAAIGPWPGHAQKANRWVDHVKTVYPESADHIIKWLASKVQSPEIKINHALVLGGDRGIGKDTILEPIKAAIGPWNFSEVAPRRCSAALTAF